MKFRDFQKKEKIIEKQLPDSNEKNNNKWIRLPLLDSPEKKI